MESAKNIARIIAWPVIILLQFIGAQIVTFLISLPFGALENFVRAQPIVMAVFIGFTYSIGIFLVGALAIKLHWLELAPKYWVRLAGVLVAVYLFLILGLIIYRGDAVDNIFFIFFSPLAGVIGFYLAERFKN